jgi:ATP-dependent RNA helicase DeaD
MTTEHDMEPGFDSLGLSEPVLRALRDIGYEAPSPVQAQTIPHLLEGRDIIGQAQTGTGKTAAFALPLLTRLDPREGRTRVLVLVPTRELAIQVSEAFRKYAAYLPGFHVLPLYGGQGYGDQLRMLKRGAHVVVATPGRLCDHLRRGTLTLDGLDCLVIDEADEMLRMGFIEEVEWILEQTTPGRQIALFSATMPAAIRRIATRHLDNPIEISIAARTATASTIRQRYWMVSGLHKLDALTRILEGEPFECMIIFVRTKTATLELADKLEARGFSAVALNGDIPQAQRESTIEKLRNGDIDILVATDVAARGLDVARISHVVNYDIPHDTESYIHRIGRTGRAGRPGEAILFVSPRERRMLLAIEKATRQKITLMDLPTREAINNIRVARFKDRIRETLAVEDLGVYMQVIEEFRRENNVPAIEIAAALARMVQGENDLLLAAEARTADEDEPPAALPERVADSGVFRTYRLDVGAEHGATTTAIVGAVANEGGLVGAQIRRLRVGPTESHVDLPEPLPAVVLRRLTRARVAGRPLALEPRDIAPAEPPRASKAPKGGAAFRKFQQSGTRKDSARLDKKKNKKPMGW